jgi:hypothetical protein
VSGVEVIVQLGEVRCDRGFMLLGGVLTDLASWRWIFFVNVPEFPASTSRSSPPPYSSARRGPSRQCS